MKRTAMKRGKPLRRRNLRRKPPRDREAWIAARDAKLRETPFCEACGAPAVVVHHLHAHGLGKRDHSAENLQSLCSLDHVAAHQHPAWWRAKFGRRPGEARE